MPYKFEVYPNHPAVAFLVRLHANLGGRIQQNKIESEHLQEDALHVEAVIKMFDPAFNLKQIAAKRRREQSAFFKRGTIFRRAVDVMRGRTEPMTVAAMADAVLIAAKITNPSKREKVALQGAIRASLEHNAGKLVERVGEAVPKRWKLIDR